jgi:predicted RNA methylase
MPGCCSHFECSASQQFNPEKVEQEVKRYRAKGPGPTTRLLVDGISESGALAGTVLDVGAGFGGLTLALLERGASSAVAVDAERRCCRFLRFTLTVEPDEGLFTLDLTGPQGTLEFVTALLDM